MHQYGYPIGVKLNSADFQKGGFTLDDSCQIAGWLQDEGIDLLGGVGFAALGLGISPQPRLDHRYLNKDIGYGLVFMS